MNLDALLTKAAQAKPIRRPRGCWAQYYPVYIKLRGQGFTREGAVQWLVSEGAVPNKEAAKALRALVQIHHRACRRAGGAE